jgi:hypothetical protein
MDEEMFKEKYLKYKRKYINLKKRMNQKDLSLVGGTFPFQLVDEHSLCSICLQKYTYREILIKGQTCAHVCHYVCLVKYLLSRFDKYFFLINTIQVACPHPDHETPWLFVAINKHRRSQSIKNNEPEGKYPFKELTDESSCKICQKKYEYNEILLQGYGKNSKTGVRCNHIIHYMCLINYILKDYRTYFLQRTNDKPVRCPECETPWTFIGINQDDDSDWGKVNNS